MNLKINKEKKIIYLTEFFLSSEDLRELGKTYKGYAFSSIEEWEAEYMEEDNFMEFPENTLLDYNTKETCDCFDKNFCEKLIKCKEVIN